MYMSVGVTTDQKQKSKISRRVTTDQKQNKLKISFIYFTSVL